MSSKCREVAGILPGLGNTDPRKHAVSGNHYGSKHPLLVEIISSVIYLLVKRKAVCILVDDPYDDKSCSWLTLKPDHTPLRDVYTTPFVPLMSEERQIRQGPYSWDGGAQQALWTQWVSEPPLWLSLNSAGLNPRRNICLQPSAVLSKFLPRVLSTSLAVSASEPNSHLQAKRSKLIR